MSKFIKKISFLTTVFLLVFTMIVPTITFSLPALPQRQVGSEVRSIFFLDDNGLRTVILEYIEKFGTTHAIFSCNAGYYFVGFYKASTTKATFVNMHGEILGSLYVRDEDSFNELLMYNIKVIHNYGEGQQSFARMSHLSAEEMIRHNITMTREKLTGQMLLGGGFELEDNRVMIYEFSPRGNAGIIREVLTSAIDDSPLITYFDPSTGRVDFFDSLGNSQGFRYVEDKNEFRAMVETNRKVMQLLASSEIDAIVEAVKSGAISANVRIVDYEMNTVIEYSSRSSRAGIHMNEAMLYMDMNSPDQSLQLDIAEYHELQKQLHQRIDNEKAYIGIAPLFNTGIVNMQVPFASTPWGGGLVGHDFFHAAHNQTRVHLNTFNFPPGMTTVDVLLTNALADDFSIFAPRSNQEVYHNRFHRGEPYGARVSTRANTNGFNGVPFRFWSSSTVASHFVNFNSMGGIPTNISPIMVTSGNQVGTLPSVTRTGYTFLGWYDAFGNRMTPATRIHAPTFAYANWQRQGSNSTLTVSPDHWDAPSGTATSPFISVRSNTDWSVITGNYYWLTSSRDHGWRDASITLRTTSANPNPTPRHATVTLRTDDWTVTQTIRVTQAPSQVQGQFTVTFDPTGGTVSPTSRQVWAGHTVGTLPTPTRQGYAFVGWFTAASGGWRVDADTPVHGNITLFARWETSAPNVLVTFNGNGGHPGSTFRLASQGQTLGMLPSNPIRLGYNFVGWYTAMNGGVRVTTNTIIHNHITFYARWSPRYLTLQPSDRWVAASAGDSRSVRVTTSYPSWRVVRRGSPNAFEISAFSDNEEPTWFSVSTTSGISGTNLVITVSPNMTYNYREGYIILHAGGLEERIDIIQPPERQITPTDVRGPRAIASFNWGGYVDANNSPTTTTIESARISRVERPIWYFVRLPGAGNYFAIRNDTTGRYMTEAGNSLHHALRISGSGTDYDNRQRWNLLSQPDGSYRIQSVSNPSMFVQENIRIGPLNDPNLTLATLNTNHNRQLWHIGNIWNTDDTYAYGGRRGRVAFWPGVIRIQAIDAGTEEQPTPFNFSQEMMNARSIWEDALDISFASVGVDDSRPSPDANIIAITGTRPQVAMTLDMYATNLPRFEHGFATLGRPYRTEVSIPFYAGGERRTVYQFSGMGMGTVPHPNIPLIGDGGMIMIVFSTTEIPTQTTIHELGHSLGYWGHSPNNSDLMWREASSTERLTLRPAEIEHLRQVYRQFR